MADLLPVNFVVPPEVAVASYDWKDLATGFGIVEFYLYDGRDTADAVVHRVGKETPISEAAEIAGTPAGVTFTFSSGTFNSTRTIKGTAILSFGAECAAANGTIQIKLFHYDGSSQTQIGSTASLTMEVLYRNYNCIIPITTPRVFAIGDTLQIELVLTGPAGNDLHIGIDPQNHDGTHITPSTVAIQSTVFICRIPFRIDR